MTLSSGPNLGLLVNGALGEAHYDELMRMWRGLDGLVQASVKSRIAALPTSGNTDGDRYILTTDSKVYRYNGLASAFEAYTPKEGWELWSVADSKKYRYASASWAEVTSGSSGSGMANPMTAAGDVIVGGVAGAPGRLAVGSQGQVLTVSSNKTLTWSTPSSGGGSAAEVYQTAAPVSGALDISAAEPTIWGVSLTGNVSSMVLPTVTGAKSITLIFTQDSTGGRTVTWPSSVTWPAGSAPSIASAAGNKTIVALVSVDSGTSWLGVLLSVSTSGGTTNALPLAGGLMTGAIRGPAMNTLSSGTLLDVQTGNKNAFYVTGNSTIEGLTAMESGTRIVLRFASTLTLKHLASAQSTTNQMALLGSADIAVAAGDVAEFICMYGDGANWKMIDYSRADGSALVAGSWSGGRLTKALQDAGLLGSDSAGLGNSANVVATNSWQLNSSSLSYIAPLATTGMTLRMRMSQDATLYDKTQSGGNNLVLPGSANISAKTGDWATFYQLDTANWELVGYARKDGTALVSGAGGLSSPIVTVPNKLRYKGYSSVTSADSFEIDKSLYGNLLTVSAGSPATITYINSSSANVGVQGDWFLMRFGAGITLKNNDFLLLPGRADIVTVDGDYAEFFCDGGAYWRCVWYSRKDGTPVVSSGGGTPSPSSMVSLTAASNLDTTSVPHQGWGFVSGLTQINNLGNAAAGKRISLQFGDAVKLGYGSGFQLLGNADITVAVGDWAEFIAGGNNLWYMTDYSRKSGQPLVSSGDFKKDGTVQMTGALKLSPLKFPTISGSTIDVTTADANYMSVPNGTAGPFNAFGSSVDGDERTLYFQNACVIGFQSGGTYTPSMKDLYLNSGDIIRIRCMGGSQWYVVDVSRTGTPTIPSIPAAATINIGKTAGEFVQVNGTANVSSLGPGIIGSVRKVRFDTAITIPHIDGTINCLGNSNTAINAGDIVEFVCTGDTAWRMIGLQRNTPQ